MKSDPAARLTVVGAVAAILMVSMLGCTAQQSRDVDSEEVSRRDQGLRSGERKKQSVGPVRQQVIRTGYQGWLERCSFTDPQGRDTNDQVIQEFVTIVSRRLSGLGKADGNSFPTVLVNSDDADMNATLYLWKQNDVYCATAVISPWTRAVLNAKGEKTKDWRDAANSLGDAIYAFIHEGWDANGEKALPDLERAARSEENKWMTDFAAAKAKAKSERKLMLVNFAGSDWCSWSVKLHDEVFDRDAFMAEASKKFVLVELDYPQKRELPPELKAQNQKLQLEYKVQGFPTIYVLDAEGKPVAKTSYQPGGPEKYLERLDGLVKSHETFVSMQGQLPAAKGAKRARMLDQLLSTQEALGLEIEDEAKLAAEIVSLDTDNKYGLKSKYTFKRHLNEGESLSAQRRFDEARQAFDKALAVPGITPEQTQEAYFQEGQICFGQKDFSGVVDRITKARDAAPTSPKAEEMDKMINRFKPMADSQATVAKLKTQLESAGGIERAKVLDQLIEAQTSLNAATQARGNSAEIETWSAEILALDAENKAGLKTKYEFKALLAEAAKESNAKEFALAEATVKKALALPGLTEEQRASALELQKDIDARQEKESGKPATK